LTSPNIAERCDAVALDDELETVIDNQAHRVCLLRCHSLACPWSPAWQDAYSTVGSPDTRCDNRRTFVRKRQTQIVASFLARSPTAPACSEPALTVCEEPQPKAATTADAGRTAQVAARFPRRADRCGTYLQDVNAMLRLADPTTASSMMRCNPSTSTQETGGSTPSRAGERQCVSGPSQPNDWAEIGRRLMAVKPYV